MPTGKRWGKSLVLTFLPTQPHSCQMKMNYDLWNTLQNLKCVGLTCILCCIVHLCNISYCAILYGGVRGIIRLIYIKAECWKVYTVPFGEVSEHCGVFPEDGEGLVVGRAGKFESQNQASSSQDVVVCLSINTCQNFSLLLCHLYYYQVTVSLTL